jgi:hypothetical protein
LYFAHFHPMLPVIHQPSFDPGRDLLVTLAVINIGACYTEFSDARSFSTALSDLIRRLLVFTAEQDRRFVRSAPYLTAQLLQGVRKSPLPFVVIWSVHWPHSFLVCKPPDGGE